jgi:hypothetical protein
VKLEDLLGHRVSYKGERGRIVEGHAGEEAAVVISIPAKSGSPRHAIIVSQRDWGDLEILD